MLTANYHTNTFILVDISQLTDSIHTHIQHAVDCILGISCSIIQFIAQGHIHPMLSL